MNVQTTLYIRQIENGFVIGYGSHNRLAGPSNSEHFFPDLDTLTDNAPGIIGEAIADARREADAVAAQIEQNRLRYPDQCGEAARQRVSQGPIVGRPC